MREIKYRAWVREEDEEYSRMVHSEQAIVTIISHKYNGKGTARPAGFSSVDNQPKPERYVLMQYTGLKDKNGNEIYESDILHVLEVGSRTLEYSSVVEFIESGFLVTEPDGTQVPLACFHNEENAIMPLFEIEVIGNIYEHPELLEGE